MAEFVWPWQYKFPPFFTVQPNLDTRQKQIEAWCSLVLAFYRHHKLYILDVTEVQNEPLFYNKAINRKLPADGVNLVLAELHKRGSIEWTDKTKRRCYVFWRTAEEWGKLIYDWAHSKGMTNTVCTCYELVNGDDTVGQAFHGLDMTILTKSLQTLELQNKAELITFDDNQGVKFF